MNLTFVRHGDAQNLASSDAERKLTDEGQSKIRKMGCHLKKNGEHYNLIFSSPLIRAKETALIISEASGYRNEVIIDERLNCNAHFKSIQDIVKENLTASHIMFVGHAPDMGIITAELLGMTHEINFKKGSILKLSSSFIRSGEGNLIYFACPEIFS